MIRWNSSQEVLLGPRLINAPATGIVPGLALWEILDYYVAPVFRGNVKKNVAPLPTADSAQTRPP